jgi:hypothetical protein
VLRGASRQLRRSSGRKCSGINIATDRGADVVRRDGKAFARFQRSPPARSPSARNGKRSAEPDDHCPVWKKIGKDRGAGVTFYMIWLYMALFPAIAALLSRTGGAGSR